MCMTHTAKLMTSKATSSYLEGRLAPSFNNGLRQLLLLQGKSASNLLFQGRQEHCSNVEATSPKEYFKRALTIPLLDHLATQKDIMTGLKTLRRLTSCKQPRFICLIYFFRGSTAIKTKLVCCTSFEIIVIKCNRHFHCNRNYLAGRCMRVAIN